MTSQFAVLIFAVLSAPATHATPPSATAPTVRARIEIDYADSFQGQPAVLAVRACVDRESHLKYLQVDSVSASSVVRTPTVEVRQVAVDNDVIVRVVDHDGFEISRHEGPANICGFARIATGFLLHAEDEGSR